MPDQITIDDALADLPPSRKLVHLVLQAEESWLGSAELACRTHLDDRTVRDCLSDLEERDLIVTRQDTDDPRRRLYRSRTD